MDDLEVAQPYARFKAKQRETWAGFAANEGVTTLAAGELIAFARVRPGEKLLDVACGTGVVAVTAARAGAHASGLDLTPALLERARENAKIAGASIEFVEGDAEALPYADASFDVVLSQWGHIFAPKPAVVTAEMLRVLKLGGRIAFTTWPPEHAFGKIFTLIERYELPPADGASMPATITQWGDAAVVKERLGDKVTGLRFGRGMMLQPALSARHVQLGLELTFGPLKTLLAVLDRDNPAQAEAVRAEVVGIAQEHMEGNIVRQHYLMSAATKVY